MVVDWRCRNGSVASGPCLSNGLRALRASRALAHGRSSQLVFDAQYLSKIVGLILSGLTC